MYRAEDVETGAVVAVKILADTTPQRLRRFEREARALRTLGVHGVVRLLGEGEHQGRRFLVTELVDGVPFPGEAGVVPWAELAPVALRLLDIVARIHEAGVLHRDLKPANVLVNAAGVPTVLDFGLARVDGAVSLTRTGDVLGTPRYQAPEQILGDHPVDARTDLYAAGVMFYEALAGRSPQPPRSVGRVYAARLVRDAPPLGTVAPDVPPAIAEVIDRMIARAPEERPGSARTVMAALGGSAPARVAGELPWLGGTGDRDAARDLLRDGGTVAIVGVRGSGRSRLLRAVEAVLAAEGRPCRRLGPGERPLESLSSALGVPLESEAAALDALRDVPGVVLLADDAAGVDAWSMRCVVAAGAAFAATWLPGEAPEGEAPEGGAPEGGVPEGGAPEGDGSRGPEAPRGLAHARARATLHLAPLDADHLAALFPRGSEAYTAASLLAALTAGLPARVAAEVGRWVADGHATWAADHLRLPAEARWVLAMGPPADARPGRRTRAPLSEPLARTLGVVALAEPWATPAALAAARGGPAWKVDAELRELVDRGLVERLPADRLRVRPDVAGVDEWATPARHDVLRALAATSPAAARLPRLLAAEAWPDAAAEALLVATDALAAGAPGPAWGAATWGLRAALAAEGPLDPRADGLVELLVQAGLALGTPGALERAASVITRVAAHRGAPASAAETAGAFMPGTATGAAMPGTATGAAMPGTATGAAMPGTATGTAPLDATGAFMPGTATGAAETAPGAAPLDALRAGLELLAAGVAGTATGPPPPLAHPALDAAREDLVFTRLLAVDPPSADTWLATHLRGAAPPSPAGPERGPMPRLALEARLRLAEGDAASAVGLLERALAAGPAPLVRARLRVLLADALLEAGALPDAGRAAADVHADATAAGFLRDAAHAAVIRRDAEVRAGAPPDPDRLREVDALGIGPLLARACLAEAAAAWRAIAYEEAVRLARRAVAADGSGGAVPILARALAFACEPGAAPTDLLDLVASADQLGIPAVSLQVRGLLALAAPAHAERLLSGTDDLARRAGPLDAPRAVLSGAEALAFCRARARRGGRA